MKEGMSTLHTASRPRWYTRHRSPTTSTFTAASRGASPIQRVARNDTPRRAKTLKLNDPHDAGEDLSMFYFALVTSLNL